MEDNMPDIEQIGKIVQTAKLLGGLMQSGNEQPQSEGETEVTEGKNSLAFDEELQSPAIRSIKAAIPYLE